MLFWIAAAGLTAIAVILIVRPLLRGGAPAAGGDTLAVYRDQLDEIARDAKRGVLGAAEAEAARAEISRRLLAANREGREGVAGRPLRALSLALTVTVPVAAAGIYLWLGTPGLPSQPLFARDTAELEAFSGAVAEAEALAERLRGAPGDVDGWAELGDRYATLGLWPEARDAYGRAAGLAAGDPGIASAYAEALVRVAEGTVTAEARRAFEAVLEMDPGDPRARFYLGLAAAQSGDYDTALAHWQDLAADTPPTAPWRETLAGELRRAAEAAGRDPEEVLSALPEPGGPGEADIAAAAELSPEERQAMIEGMVSGLAARLEAAPDDAAGWLRLADAYRVLDRPADARLAYRRAIEAAAAAPELLRVAIQGVIDLAPPADLPADLRPPLEALLGMVPQDETALFFLGLLAAQEGDEATALSHWRPLLDLMPEDSAARAALARQIAQMAAEPGPDEGAPGEAPQ
ncbi:MAG: c-type cytochrome biogenesis protein CcmI [Azospirillaceae bacterium]